MSLERSKTTYSQQDLLSLPERQPDDLEFTVICERCQSELSVYLPVSMVEKDSEASSTLDFDDEEECDQCYEDITEDQETSDGTTREDLSRSSSTWTTRAHQGRSRRQDG